MMASQPARCPFTDLEKHDMGWFPVTLLKRRKTIAETLDLFEADDRFGLNRATITRTHHLYQPTSECFDLLRQALVKNSGFVHVEVRHERSDLGIPYKVVARDKAGIEIMYDGVLFRMTELLHQGSFTAEQISELGGSPRPLGGAFDLLRESLQEVMQEFREGCSFHTL